MKFDVSIVSQFLYDFSFKSLWASSSVLFFGIFIQFLELFHVFPFDVYHLLRDFT